MRSPVERLEEWCDEEEARLCNPVVVDAYREIIAKYRERASRGEGARRNAEIYSGNKRIAETEKTLAELYEHQAYGLSLTIELLADAVNPEEAPDGV